MQSGPLGPPSWPSVPTCLVADICPSSWAPRVTNSTSGILSCTAVDSGFPPGLTRPPWISASFPRASPKEGIFSLGIFTLASQPLLLPSNSVAPGTSSPASLSRPLTPNLGRLNLGPLSLASVPATSTLPVGRWESRLSCGMDRSRAGSRPASPVPLASASVPTRALGSEMANLDTFSLAARPAPSASALVTFGPESPNLGRENLEEGLTFTSVTSTCLSSASTVGSCGVTISTEGNQKATSLTPATTPGASDCSTLPTSAAGTCPSRPKAPGRSSSTEGSVRGGTPTRASLPISGFRQGSVTSFPETSALASSDLPRDGDSALPSLGMVILDILKPDSTPSASSALAAFSCTSGALGSFTSGAFGRCTSGTFGACTSGSRISDTFGSCTSGRCTSGTTISGNLGSFSSETFGSCTSGRCTSGTTISGTFGSFISGTFISDTFGSCTSGRRTSGTTISGNLGSFISETFGSCTSGSRTSGTAISGTFGSFISGHFISGTFGSFSSGTFGSCTSGTAISGTFGSFTSGTFGSCTSGSLTSGTAISGNFGSFISDTLGSSTSGSRTSGRAASGILGSLTSGALGSFTSGPLASLASGGETPMPKEGILMVGSFSLLSTASGAAGRGSRRESPKVGIRSLGPFTLASGLPLATLASATSFARAPKRGKLRRGIFRATSGASTRASTSAPGKARSTSTVGAATSRVGTVTAAAPSRVSRQGSVGRVGSEGKVGSSTCGTWIPPAAGSTAGAAGAPSPRVGKWRAKPLTTSAAGATSPLGAVTWGTPTSAPGSRGPTSSTWGAVNRAPAAPSASALAFLGGGAAAASRATWASSATSRTRSRGSWRRRRVGAAGTGPLTASTLRPRRRRENLGKENSTSTGARSAGTPRAPGTTIFFFFTGDRLWMFWGERREAAGGGTVGGLG
ncbi:hypothetical protein DBR06_SOUSAS1610317, partial [Sousa chinensis]